MAWRKRGKLGSLHRPQGYLWKHGAFERKRVGLLKWRKLWLWRNEGNCCDEIWTSVILLKYYHKNEGDKKNVKNKYLNFV